MAHKGVLDHNSTNSYLIKHARVRDDRGRLITDQAEVETLAVHSRRRGDPITYRLHPSPENINFLPVDAKGSFLTSESIERTPGLNFNELKRQISEDYLRKWVERLFHFEALIIQYRGRVAPYLL